MLTLLKSEKFQKDYRDYKTAIASLTNPDTKKRAEQLLTKLVNEVKFIDSRHQELFLTGNTPARLEESKLTINSIRKQLDRIIKNL
jgi:hypothetical protein